MKKILLAFVLCLSLTGCLNPFAKVGQNAAKENRKNVDYMAEKLTKYYEKELTGYYKKDPAKKVLTQDDFNDRMVPVKEAKTLAQKMEEAFKK